MDSSNYNNRQYQRLFYGGLQKHYPRNEAGQYKNLFTIDVSSYCLKDFSTNELSESEIKNRKLKE